MKRVEQILLMIAVLLCSAAVNAHDFEVDGIYYNITSETKKTVEVTCKGSSYNEYKDEYTGSVVIPTTVTYNSVTYSVTSIRYAAFQNCENLTSITIPNSIIFIGYGAFSGTAWYNNQPNGVVYAGKVLYDYKGAMPENTSIVVEDGTLSIAGYAFSRCTGLTSITIPNSVTTIESMAFMECTGLTSVTIPNSVTTIGSGAFDDTAWYNNQPDGIVYAGKVLCKYKGKMPENTSIVVKDGTLGIAGSALLNCSGLASITIPNSVTNIGNRAFDGCSGLTSITIPSSVTNIEDYPLANCADLISIIVEDGNSVYDSRDNCNAIIETSTNTLVAGCKNTVIPNSVTNIGNRAFDGCSGLTSITIPSSVTNIGDYPFANCTGLSSIVVEDGNSYYDSRDNCNAVIETSTNTLITGCKNTVIPNSVTTIGSHAFDGCSGLTSITIPSSVTNIGDYAFFYCSNLTSITIPNSVTAIGGYAFCYCSNLTSITIPYKVTTIEDGTFGYCSSLNSVTIPNNVTTIGMAAFINCSGLTSITIPNSVTAIKSGAFMYCSNLSSVYMESNTPEALEVNGFHNISNNATLYVPMGAKAAYEEDDILNYFANIVEGAPLTVSSVGYASIYLDYPVEIPEGVKVYTGNRVEGDLLKMEEVTDVIPANTGVIIRAAEGTYPLVYSDETPEAIEDNLLTGSTTDTYITPASNEKHYVLSVVDGVVGMYRPKLNSEGKFLNNANKAYMVLRDGLIVDNDTNVDTGNTGTQLSNGYRFDFAGTTAIENIVTESASIAPTYYDLSGRRIENPTKGIYILNGKKVLVK